MGQNPNFPNGEHALACMLWNAKDFERVEWEFAEGQP
jgi:hypothetical protein